MGVQPQKIDFRCFVKLFKSRLQFCYAFEDIKDMKKQIKNKNKTFSVEKEGKLFSADS